jgi:hypothetical protein
LSILSVLIHQAQDGCYCIRKGSENEFEMVLMAYDLTTNCIIKFKINGNYNSGDKMVIKRGVVFYVQNNVTCNQYELFNFFVERPINFIFKKKRYFQV